MLLNKVIFEQWEEDNKQFVETKATKEVERLIKCQNIVIVIGQIGSGKSAIVHHIALKYRSQGWKVKPVSTVMDVVQIIKTSICDQDDRILFVLSDPIGKDSFDELKYTLWRKYEETLKASFKTVKVMMSCRKYIMNNNQVKGLLKDKSHIVDLSNDNFKLSIKEKENICNRYDVDKTVSRKELEEIIQTDAYFPLLCKLYFTNRANIKEKLRFFKSPVEFFEREIQTFRESCKEKYCALVLLVLFNNNCCVEDIMKCAISIEKFELALQLCGMCKSTAPHTIVNAFETLQGFFVKKIGNMYHFYCDLVIEVTTFVFGKNYPLELIKYADIGFLREKVKLGYHHKTDQFTIYLSDAYIDALGRRLFNDIFEDRLLDVVLNPCLKNEKVITFFINELERHPEKLRELLKKKQLPIDHQEMNLTSNHLFLSKLAFVSLEERISPLSAIIIFCSTRLSFYCINALRQMQELFIGHSVFSLLCCTGSKDLFDMFIEDRISEFLEEKWKFLYPIHIASAFNNNDILHKLLQNGANVNLKTTNENYWTPLTLAAGNQIEENNENEKITPTETKRTGTMNLLLSNGADIDLCIENGASPLYIACQEGYDSIVQMLLTKGADINKCTKNGTSPFTIACQEGHESIVQTLVDSGANINSSMENGSTPLFKACQEGHDKIVELLLQKGADANHRIKDGSSPLFIACKEGHANIVQMLLNSEANINSCDKDGVSPLHIACKKGYEIIVENLLEKGADYNLCDNNGDSPLHVACQNGHSRTALYLLNRGANVDKCDKNGNNSLYLACQEGHILVVRVLIQSKADTNFLKKNGASPLYIACKNGHDEIVKLLLTREAKLNFCAADGTSPLVVACQYGHEKVIDILLQNGANINLCLENGFSPLITACENGHERIVQYLLSKGANINLCNRFGVGPLHISCLRGLYNIVQLLLSNGADVNQCGKSGTRPLHIACEHKFDNIVQILLSNGADINLCDEYGASPLYKACEHGYDSVVQILLSKGADINRCLKNGASPLHIACKNKFESTVQLLLSKGADINACT